MRKYLLLIFVVFLLAYPQPIYAGECLGSIEEYLDILRTADINDSSGVGNDAYEALHCLYHKTSYYGMGYEFFASPTIIDKIIERTEPYRERVYELVPKFLESTVPFIREHAIGALAFYRWPQSFEYMVKHELFSPVLFAILGDKRAIPILIHHYWKLEKTYKTKPKFSYPQKMNCLNALYHLASPEILLFIDSVIENPKPPEILKRADKVRSRILKLYPDADKMEKGWNDVYFGGELYKSVFYNYIPEYSPANIDTTDLPKDIRHAITRYIQRSEEFISRFSLPEVAEFPKEEIIRKKQAIEQAIVSLINREGVKNDSIGEIAYHYAKESVIAYEWEGFSDGPLDEAKFAEDFLRDNPDTPIKAYLYLFLMHRYRCAFECFVYEKNIDGQEEASSKYQQNYELANEYHTSVVVDMILIRLIADDIDKQLYLYIETEQHPRNIKSSQ